MVAVTSLRVWTSNTSGRRARHQPGIDPARAAPTADRPVAQQAQSRTELTGIGRGAAVEPHQQAGAPGGGDFTVAPRASDIPELVNPMQNERVWI